MPPVEKPTSLKQLRPIKKIGPLFISERFKDAKDPCICFDGVTWHIYGSGGDTRPEEWEILHATAPHIEGPWAEVEPPVLRGVEGPHVAAPSVVYDLDDKLFHMAVQKDFMDVGGGIAYLVSADGHIFTKMRTLVSASGEKEAGLYDPHFAVIKNEKYIVYSGIPAVSVRGNAATEAGATGPDAEIHPFIPQPDVYLARSMSNRWAGYWKRVKAILRHEDIAWHHNRREHPDYEWGIEGPQLVELPDGCVLLNATCFIEEGRRGTRQRVFFAIANDVKGPYATLGPVLPILNGNQSLEGGNEPLAEWENGENGHASAVVYENKLYLFYQARSQTNPIPTENRWSYGIAVFEIKDMCSHQEKLSN